MSSFRRRIKYFLVDRYRTNDSNISGGGVFQ
jgi:hypothetical protein